MPCKHAAYVAIVSHAPPVGPIARRELEPGMIVRLPGFKTEFYVWAREGDQVALLPTEPQGFGSREIRWARASQCRRLLWPDERMGIVCS